MTKIDFLTIPLVCPINRAADERGHALINITPATLAINDRQITIPALFISDGMSVPNIADAVIEPRDGIIAGHLHDYFYSNNERARQAQHIAAAAMNTNPREAADKIMLAYMQQHCPGLNFAERRAAHAAVRIFGEKFYHDPAQDTWRAKIAKIFGLPGDGMGATSNDGFIGDILARLVAWDYDATPLHEKMEIKRAARLLYRLTQTQDSLAAQ